jgi:hypothetical protein
MSEYLEHMDFRDRSFTTTPPQRNDSGDTKDYKLLEQSRSPESVISMSSMVLEVTSSVGAMPPSIASSSTPGLTVGTSVASFSVDQSHDPVQGAKLLTPDGVELADGPVYTCCFWYLHCYYRAADEGEWKLHCKSHLHGRPPPKTAACPFCPAKFESTDGEISWATKMDHMAEHHRDRVDLSRNTRPDFEMFRYLWQQKIIGYPDYQELMSNYGLSRPSQHFVQHGGRIRDDRLRGRPAPQLRVMALPRS